MNVRTRAPTANGGVGLRGSGARAEAADFAAAVGSAVAVDFVVAVGGREAVVLAPPHPAITTAIATPRAATPRIRDANSEAMAEA
jgi:hypothetical protein